MLNDELYELKNHFYVGNWRAAVDEARRIETFDDAARTERDVFLFRALAALGDHARVAAEIGASADVALQCVKLAAQLAQYRAAAGDDDSEALACLDQMKSLCAAASIHVPVYARIVTAFACLQEARFDDCMRMLAGLNHLEAHAIRVQLYLQLNRFELADREVQTMTKIDEYDVLTQLASVWLVALAPSYETQRRLAESGASTCEELMVKFSRTPQLLNMAAVCQAVLSPQNVSAMERPLAEAHQIDAAYPETLANLVYRHEHAGKHEAALTALKQLGDAQPRHHLVHAYNAFSAALDAQAARGSSA